ncbi:B12-binding domain-containing radical SAM protein [Pseudenhygromyxa sp. WMMC2535]|uniref:B12-binding domain-containing radical SAM protein n=1 Tax=Pseudenhygromyxa sp. WMMC2535 TaxID=2712867 RepID=UPI00155695CA|nr:radical SAM protein [Pseudenhygromyxa sp. WMMC2535]NVB40369.1 B12-binding domain-containing radical SAM protein [Pseudenhygromyxa sp. WMMC2535]
MNQPVDLVQIRRPEGGGDHARVTLINLPTITAPRSLSYYGAVPPLGLAYIAAALIAAGHPIQIVDATGAGFETSITRHTEAGPLEVTGLTIPQIVGAVDPAAEVIGISNMFLHQWPLLRDLAVALKQRYPKARIVIGGENATSFWAHMLGDCAAIECCVLGEGERTIVALLRAWAEGRGCESVPGVAYRDASGTPRSTGLGARIEDLDSLPEPAWSLFPVDAYLDRRRSGGVDRGRSMPLLTSRGCPYRCSFCSSPQMWTTRYLRRSPALVVDEIARYVERYRITNVDLNDLTAMLTKDWMIEFAKAMIDRGLAVSVQLPSGTRSEAVDAEAAAWLYRAGVRNFCYAPESGSARTLERIHKKVKLPRLRASLAAAIEAGLTTHASIVIGFPHEGPAELLETYRLVLQLALDGLDTAAVMVFAPYPGSEEYDRLLEQGVVIHDERYFYGSLLRSAGATRSVHPRWSAEQLAALQMGFLLSFYALAYARRPQRLVHVARRVLAGRQESVMDKFLSTKLSQFTVRARSSRESSPA